MIKSCCCLSSLRKAVVAAGVLTTVTSTMQILVILSVFTGSAELMGNVPIFENINGTTVLPPAQRNTAITYIVLAVADVLLILCSIVMLFGADPATKGHRCYFYPWIFYQFIYIIYESGINIAFFSQAFDARRKPPVAGDRFDVARDYLPHTHALGFLVVPLVYWIVKTLIVFAFWLVVIVYVRQVIEGKAKTPYQDTSIEVADGPDAVLAAPANQPYLATRTAGNLVYAANLRPGNTPVYGVAPFRGYDGPGAPCCLNNPYSGGRVVPSSGNPVSMAKGQYY